MPKSQADFRSTCSFLLLIFCLSGCGPTVKDATAGSGGTQQALTVVHEFAGLQGVESADRILARVIQSDKPIYFFLSGGENVGAVRTDKGFQLADGYGDHLLFWEWQARKQIPKDADVCALIAMGPKVAPLVNISLGTVTPESPAAARLALVLREIGTRESVPVLIELLRRATEPSENALILKT